MSKIVKDKSPQIIGVLLILFGVVLRIIPHSPNFAPVGAISLFSGTYLSAPYFFVVPILTMLVSDYFIGFYDIEVMASVYLSFVFISFFSFILRKAKKTPVSIAIFSLGASLLFYIITNFAVWVFTPLYSKDLVGLLRCYVMALPFLKNTILSDLFYSGFLFLLYELFLRKKEILWEQRNKILIKTVENY